MSRSGYHDDCDDMWASIRWRGAVASAMRGKRGQQALREIAAALDAMPVKELAAESLVTAEGEYCTLGALGQARGIDMAPLDPEDREAVAAAFGIAPAMAAEIVYENDDGFDGRDWDSKEFAMFPEAAARRWRHMRKWIQEQIDAHSAQGATGGVS